MLSPDVVFEVYFRDEIFAAGVNACPEGEFRTFEAVGSCGRDGTGEALAVVSRADVNTEIIFLGESFGTTCKGTGYFLALGKCGAWLQATAAGVFSLNMSFELSLTAALEIAEYTIRVLSANVLRELIFGSEPNLPWNILVMTRFGCRTLITPIP